MRARAPARMRARIYAARIWVWAPVLCTIRIHFSTSNLVPNPNGVTSTIFAHDLILGGRVELRSVVLQLNRRERFRML
jgi:hypothetical protein